MKPIERFAVREVGPRDWGKEILIGLTDDYMGKVLVMNEGSAGGLQYHVDKDETFFLFSGSAEVTSDDGSGELTRYVMEPGESFRIPTEAPHKVKALTECIFFEVSKPVFDDRVRCETDYGLPEDAGLPTTRR